MGLVKWYFEPLVDILEYMRMPVPTKFYHPDKVILPTHGNKVLFRPKNFGEYIGQEKAKARLNAFIDGTTSRNLVFPHTLIHGNAGCGKTTLARIIANTLNIPFVEMIASDIDTSYDILCKLDTMSTTYNTPGILFIDEIHAMDRKTVESLYPLMEDFAQDGRPIMPFTLIGATTELGEILEDRRPFYDRFKIIVELEPYAAKDISVIVQQYRNQTFPNETLSGDVYDVIGKNARATPRTGIRLLETTIYLGDVNKALWNFGIIKDGYTSKDLKCLKYIEQNTKGVGLQALSSYLGLPTASFLFDMEPYLLQNNIIVRSSRGRVITEQGKQLIKELA